MINKAITFFLLLIFGGSAQANYVNIRPLVDESALVTQLAIPFIVESGEIQVDSVKSIEFVGNSNCKSFINYLKTDSFLIKCTSPEPVTLKIEVSTNSKVFKFTYGPLPIKDISEYGSVVGENPGSDVEFELGKTLFYKREGGKSACIDCHTPSDALLKRGLTTDSLKAAFANVNQMKNGTIWSIRGLTNDELIALVKYIKNN